MCSEERLKQIRRSGFNRLSLSSALALEAERKMNDMISNFQNELRAMLF